MFTGVFRPVGPIVPCVWRIGAVRRTPGTAAMACCAAVDSEIPEPTMPTTASAPVSCHDAATSPRCTASLTMPPNAITASASTRANAGRTAVSEVRALRARPTYPVTPRRATASRSRARSTTG